MSKKRLGRGLDALLSERSATQQSAAQEAVGNDAQGGTTNESAATPVASPGSLEIGIDDIQPSPYQPRRHFEPEALADLANSIARQGLLQPIVVREKPQGGYELIAGERRWRAARQAGLEALPALVRSVTDEEASAFALIENIQREDLTALEEAMGLARLRDEFELTQQEIADAVGKSRVAIANLLRLLNLGSTARGLLERGALDMGHARALLSVDGILQDQLAQQVAEQGLSVRQTEALVRRATQPKKAADKPPSRKDADTQRLEQRLTDHLGAPVAIKHAADGRGELTIRYSNLDELDGVLKHFGLDE